MYTLSLHDSVPILAIVASERSQPSAIAQSGRQVWSRTGIAIGTAPYTSPEQARGEELDERTDLFSFGSVLYEMATGRQPFAGESSEVIFTAVLTNSPTPPLRLNPELPVELERIVHK